MEARSRIAQSSINACGFLHCFCPSFGQVGSVLAIWPTSHSLSQTSPFLKTSYSEKNEKRGEKLFGGAHLVALPRATQTFCYSIRCLTHADDPSFTLSNYLGVCERGGFSLPPIKTTPTPEVLSLTGGHCGLGELLVRVSVARTVAEAHPVPALISIWLILVRSRQHSTLDNRKVSKQIPFTYSC